MATNSKTTYGSPTSYSAPTFDWQTAARSVQDPWSALGLLLGQYLVTNYDKRGEQKFSKSMANSIPGYGGEAQPQGAPAQGAQPQGAAPTVGEQLANRPSVNETAAQNMFDQYRQANGAAVQPNYEVGLEALRNQPTTSPLEAAALQQAMAGGAPAQQGISPAEAQVYADYLKNNTPVIDAGGNLSNVPNVQEAQPANQQAVQGTDASGLVPKFSVDEWKAQMYAEGRRQGRPAHQIQAVIDEMTPMAEAAEKRYNDQMADYWLSQMTANEPGSQGWLAAAINYEKHAPESAKLAFAYSPTGRSTQEQGYKQDNMKLQSNLTDQRDANKTRRDLESYGVKLSMQNEQSENRIRRLVDAGMDPSLAIMSVYGGGGSGRGGNYVKTTKAQQQFVNGIGTFLNKTLPEALMAGDADKLATVLDLGNVYLYENDDLWDNIPESEREDTAAVKNELSRRLTQAQYMRELRAYGPDSENTKKYAAALSPADRLEVNNWLEASFAKRQAANKPEKSTSSAPAPDPYKQWGVANQ